MSEASVSSFFEEFKVLKLSDIAKLMRVSSIKRYAAGELIARPGDKFPYSLGIIKGIVRTYVLTSDGEEKTIRLVAEKQVAGCGECILRNEESQEYLEALEDCTVVRIHTPKVYDLAKEELRIMRFYNKAMSEAFYESIQRIQFFVTLSPEERYLQLVKEHPELLQRVPQKYLASFIGVSTVSLSRIRARVAKKEV